MRRFANFKIFASASALVCAALAVAIAFAQSPDPKQEAAKLQPGAYYWTGIAWQPLEPLAWSANGVDKEGKLSVFKYRHPQARVQLAGAIPLFCYKFIEAAPASADPPTSLSLNVVIARLDQKKDHRQMETPTEAGDFKFNAGWSKQRTPEITVTKVTAGVILISPKEPLAPGEYVLGGSSLAITGYDFGFHSAK